MGGRDQGLQEWLLGSSGDQLRGLAGWVGVGNWKGRRGARLGPRPGGEHGVVGNSWDVGLAWAEAPHGEEGGSEAGRDAGLQFSSKRKGREGQRRTAASKHGLTPLSTATHV